VALLDLFIGQGSGLDVARYLRARQPDVRCILITALPNFDSASEAIRLRIFDYLVKPVGRLDVVGVVGQAAAAKARETEYAALLQEHERYHENLERHVQERTVALNQTAAELHALAGHLQVVREEERASLARELHDEFGQNLTALQIDLDWLDRHLRSAQPIDMAGLQARVSTMAPLTERLTAMTQMVCTALRPAILDDLGLQAAIEWQVEEFEKRSGLTCLLTLPDTDIELDRDRALALFRIVQEALTNVVRHAQATCVKVRLSNVGQELQLEVQDDGRGFVPGGTPMTSSLGLLSMRERAAVFSGEVSVESAPGKGTSVRVHMPRKEKTA
jgi:signal transduction histidine kinase